MDASECFIEDAPVHGSGSRKGHRPQRTCIACGKKTEKYRLLRVVADGEGRLKWDREQRLPGRGAYLCPGSKCLQRAIKRGSFNRAFRRKVDAAGLEAVGS